MISARMVVMLGISATSVGVAGETLTPINVQNVRVGGEIGRRIDITVRNNLLKIDHEADFLESFRQRRRAAFSYVGLGKEIDAAVRFAYYTQDKEVIDLKNHLVAETIKAQLDDGYIGIFEDKPRIEKPTEAELGLGGRLQVWWDIHEMSYIIHGLVSDYRYFGNKDALATACKAADYIMAKREPIPIVVHVSTTGLETAFLALADATGEVKYRDYVNYETGLARWRGEIEGHTYNQICVALAQLDLYRESHDPGLLAQSHRIWRFLNDEGGLLVTGTCSRNEGWHKTQEDTGKTAETCVTAYLIRWLDRMLQIEGKPEYGDLMERAIYNALFAAQSPDGRELRKYTAHTGKREYYEGEPSSDNKRDTYCCPNNYRRIIAELPGMIYYRQGDDVVVNLYTISQLRFEVGDVGVQVKQATNYPSDGRVLLEVQPDSPTEFRLLLRIPAWCQSPQVRVNGQRTTEQVKSGAYVTLARQWQPGDKVELELPMEPIWRDGSGVHAGQISLHYGPLVFCVNPARQAIEVRKKLEESALVVTKEKKTIAPLAIEPKSISGPFTDNSIRPQGIGFTLKVRGSSTTDPLVLSEFADPGGEWTFLGDNSTSPED